LNILDFVDAILMLTLKNNTLQPFYLKRQPSYISDTFVEVTEMNNFVAYITELSLQIKSYKVFFLFFSNQHQNGDHGSKKINRLYRRFF